MLSFVHTDCLIIDSVAHDEIKYSGFISWYLLLCTPFCPCCSLHLLLFNALLTTMFSFESSLNVKVSMVEWHHHYHSFDDVLKALKRINDMFLSYFSTKQRSGCKQHTCWVLERIQRHLLLFSPNIVQLDRFWCQNVPNQFMLSCLLSLSKGTRETLA